MIVVGVVMLNLGGGHGDRADGSAGVAHPAVDGVEYGWRRRPVNQPLIH